MRLRYLSFLLAFCCFLVLLQTSCLNNRNATESSFAADTLRISDKLRDISENMNMDYDSACEKITKLRTEAQTIGYTRGVAISHYIEGIFQLWNACFNLAYESFLKAQEAALVINDSLFIAKCYEQLGSIHFNHDNLGLGSKLYFQALKIYESLNYEEGIADVYLSLGLIKCAENEIEDAKNYIFKGVKFYFSEVDIYEKALKKSYLGHLYTVSGEYNKALKVFKNIETILIAFEDRINLSRIYYDISKVFHKTGENDSALFYIDKSMQLAYNQMDTSLLSLLYCVKGDLYLKDLLYDSAALFLEKSIYFSELLGDVVNKLNALNLLYIIDTIAGNHQDALQKSAQILVLKDSLSENRSANTLKITELEYESEKNQVLLSKKEVETLASAKKNKMLKAILALSITSIVSILILSVLKVKSQRFEKLFLESEIKRKGEIISNLEKEEQLKNLQIQLIEENIKLKQREQVGFAMAIAQKQEIIEIIDEKIKEILDERKTVSIDDLKSMIPLLKNHKDLSNQQDVFYDTFVELHSGFFDKLKEFHPELTKTELKFCAYLKLNFSSHQLVKILNVTNEAIRKTRYRIRKKLCLLPGESLEDYISRI